LRLKLIACEILYREICSVVARSVNQVDVEFLPKGLHDVGQAAMFARLKQALDAVDETAYDAVVMGYALCSNGLVGLTARTVPLVVPRAHDCITLFLGSKERYLDYFHSHPGVYYKTTGWIERGSGMVQLDPDTRQPTRAVNLTYEDLVAKYGEDNARFLQEQLDNMTHNYAAMTFIEMGIEPDDRFERQARQEAAEKGWHFDKLAGDVGLLRSLVDGDWDDERFLVVPPGHSVQPSFDEGIIKAVRVDA
jgi:hypothetical protein